MSASEVVCSSLPLLVYHSLSVLEERTGMSNAHREGESLDEKQRILGSELMLCCRASPHRSYCVTNAGSVRRSSISEREW